MPRRRKKFSEHRNDILKNQQKQQSQKSQNPVDVESQPTPNDFQNPSKKILSSDILSMGFMSDIQKTLTQLSAPPVWGNPLIILSKTDIACDTLDAVNHFSYFGEDETLDGAKKQTDYTFLKTQTVFHEFYESDSDEEEGSYGSAAISHSKISKVGPGKNFLSGPQLIHASARRKRPRN